MIRRFGGQQAVEDFARDRITRIVADVVPAESGSVAGTVEGIADALTDPPTSFATRTKARSLGAPVVLRFSDGATRIVYATTDRQLVALDGVHGDTLWRVTVPSALSGSIATAAIGNGRVGIFAGGGTGTMYGFDSDGVALAGWPRTGFGGSLSVSTGDLDGDGAAEIVVATTDGTAWALRRNGNTLPGFPYISGVLGGSVALADLGGSPGREIVYLDGNAGLHALDWHGAELQGWPVAAPTNSRAPIVVSLGTRRETAIVVAGSGRMDAITAAGNVRWSNTYAGNPSQDPIAGDLDGDGVDEVLVPLTSPLQLRAVDSSGVATTRAGWPLTLTAAPLGALVMGPLASGGRTCVGWFTSAGFVAYDDSARAVYGFPRPGLAGAAPNLSELDGDGATEIAMGVSNSDSSFYAFDAGASAARLAQGEVTVIVGKPRLCKPGQLTRAQYAAKLTELRAAAAAGDLTQDQLDRYETELVGCLK